ncbi:10781_t:CDS:2 [Cetraspora pellucida]|uniref:(d)CMP kinase n=1 Tax=Cetraspora pellucida TaxID=1433469 RepID=A0A9N9CRK4_9GLOM|nr:10781_t:CDS:2 [Cetraspora pellucida]
MKITNNAVKLVNIYVQYYKDLKELEKQYFKLESLLCIAAQKFHNTYKCLFNQFLLYSYYDFTNIDSEIKINNLFTIVYLMELLHTIFQNFNTNKLINITIDRYAAVGKTSVGEAIANQYGYQFIDSGKIVKSKEFVVVDYDITTLCLSDAEVKIILSADMETRIARCAFQTNLKDYTNIFNNILERDVLSQSLIKQAYNVSYEINTTKLTLSEVVDMILIQVFKKILSITY